LHGVFCCSLMYFHWYTYAGFFVFFNLEIFLIYHFVPHFVKLNSKQKNTLVNFQTCTLLSGIGIYFYYLFVCTQFDITVLKESLSPFQMSIAELAPLFLMSTYCMELFMYYSNCNVLHHGSWIVMLSCFVFMDWSLQVTLYFLMEISSFVYCIGTFWKKCRSDCLFGLTFFAFRIVYITVLSIQLFYNTTIAYPFVIFIICTQAKMFYEWICYVIRKRYNPIKVQEQSKV